MFSLHSFDSAEIDKEAAAQKRFQVEGRKQIRLEIEREPLEVISMESLKMKTVIAWRWRTNEKFPNREVSSDLMLWLVNQGDTQSISRIQISDFNPFHCREVDSRLRRPPSPRGDDSRINQKILKLRENGKGERNPC